MLFMWSSSWTVGAKSGRSEHAIRSSYADATCKTIICGQQIDKTHRENAYKRLPRTQWWESKGRTCCMQFCIYVCETWTNHPKIPENLCHIFWAVYLCICWLLVAICCRPMECFQYTVKKRTTTSPLCNNHNFQGDVSLSAVPTFANCHQSQLPRAKIPTDFSNECIKISLRCQNGSFLRATQNRVTMRNYVLPLPLPRSLHTRIIIGDKMELFFFSLFLVLFACSVYAMNFLHFGMFCSCVAIELSLMI